MVESCSGQPFKIGQRFGCFLKPVNSSHLPASFCIPASIDRFPKSVALGTYGVAFVPVDIGIGSSENPNPSSFSFQPLPPFKPASIVSPSPPPLSPNPPRHKQYWLKSS